MGKPDQYYLMASDAGYGFITKLENLFTKNRAGKALLKLPKESKVLLPQMIADVETQFVAAITSEGHLLLFPIADLPELPRGKGNKIINIPSARLAKREEYCVAMAILYENSSLTLYSGKRHFTLKPKDLVNFHGERGRRGNKLPRGFRKVDRVSVDET